MYLLGIYLAQREVVAGSRPSTCHSIVKVTFCGGRPAHEMATYEVVGEKGATLTLRERRVIVRQRNRRKTMIFAYGRSNDLPGWLAKLAIGIKVVWPCRTNAVASTAPPPPFTLTGQNLSQ